MTTLAEKIAQLPEERWRRIEERANTLIAEEVWRLNKVEREAKARQTSR